jgi:hypothetical protein
MMELFAHEYTVSPQLSERMQVVGRQMEFARNYLLTLLDGLTEQEWFWSPPNFPTHIAWQVGHISMAQYGLALFRQRGRAEVDSELMSSKFRKLFMRGSEPILERAVHPTPAEILRVLHRVQQQVGIELPGFDGDGLDDPVEAPHAAFATRYGALIFSSQHEMLHCGQIGMLRRLMGKPALR